MEAATPVTGAFLAVAFADGRFEPSEEARFLATVANDPALACVSTKALQEAYNILREEFDADYLAATAKTLESIAAIKNRPEICAAVKLAARSAIVADRHIAPQEEVVLNQIAETLGLPPGSL